MPAMPPSRSASWPAARHDVRELDGKIASEKTFTFIKRQVSPETADRIAALKLPGVHQEKEYRRFYPTGDMTAHIVGFTGVDDKGLEGVELAFQAACLGRPGSRTRHPRPARQHRRGCRRDQAAAGWQGCSPGARLQDPVPGLQPAARRRSRSTMPRPVAPSSSMPHRRNPGAGQLADLQPEQPRAPVRRATAQPRNDRYLRAGFGDEAVYRCAGAGAGKVRFDTVINCAPAG
jgi:cell division protein FtsI (penicillin-binding protein 3)